MNNYSEAAKQQHVQWLQLKLAGAQQTLIDAQASILRAEAEINYFKQMMEQLESQTSSMIELGENLVKLGQPLNTLLVECSINADKDCLGFNELCTAAGSKNNPSLSLNGSPLLPKSGEVGENLVKLGQHLFTPLVERRINADEGCPSNTCLCATAVENKPRNESTQDNLGHQTESAITLDIEVNGLNCLDQATQPDPIPSGLKKPELSRSTEPGKNGVGADVVELLSVQTIHDASQTTQHPPSPLIPEKSDLDNNVETSEHPSKRTPKEMLIPKYSSLTMKDAIELCLKEAGKPTSVQDMALEMFEVELKSEMKYACAVLSSNLSRGKNDKWKIVGRGVWELVDPEKNKQLSITDVAA